MKGPLDDGRAFPVCPLDVARAGEAQDAADADIKRVEAWKADKDANREDRYVRYILKELGVPGSQAYLRSLVKAQGGDKFTFAWLHGYLDGWPLWLTSVWVPYTYRNFYPKLYKGFTTTAVYKTYVEAVDTIPEGQEGCGVVFTMAGVAGMYGTMVLHDLNTPLQENKTMIILRVRKKFLVIEQLGDLLARYAGNIKGPAY